MTNIYTCQFIGVIIDGYAVVVAESLDEAKAVLAAKLAPLRLKLSPHDRWATIDTEVPGVTILDDGDY